MPKAWLAAVWCSKTKQFEQSSTNSDCSSFSKALQVTGQSVRVSTTDRTRLCSFPRSLKKFQKCIVECCSQFVNTYLHVIAFEMRFRKAPFGHKWAPFCANDSMDLSIWYRTRFRGSCKNVSNKFTWSGMSINVAHESCVNESKITTTKFSDGYLGNKLMHNVLTRAAVFASWCMCRKTGMSWSFMLIGVCSDSIIDATLEHMLMAKVLKDWIRNGFRQMIMIGKKSILWLGGKQYTRMYSSFNFNCVMAV